MMNPELYCHFISRINCARSTTCNQPVKYRQDAVLDSCLLNLINL